MREFKIEKAQRRRVPLNIGLVGPSGSGKTLSALRLAAGIGGKVAVIDTEAGRALHYADSFDFMHLNLEPPFDSGSYQAAIEACVKAGATTIVVDSMSHEHEGPGGLLEKHAAEMERLSGGRGNSQKHNMRAWQAPKAARTRLIHRIIQLGCNVILCFRAKDKIEIKGGGEPASLGWMPVGGDEFWYEMTARCLLHPNCGGVPLWRSDLPGERLVMKLPQQFRGVLDDGQPLSEAHGRAMAKWAEGAPEVAAPRAAASASAPPEAEAPAQPEAPKADSAAMTLDERGFYVFPRGEYRGLPVDDSRIPDDYLQRLLASDKTPLEFAQQIEDVLDRRQAWS